MLRANRDELADQGVFYPGTADSPLSQMLAVWDLLGRRRRQDRDDRITGQWSSLASRVADDDHPVTLLSEEHLSLATAAQARRAVASFAGLEAHVVVTARDLGRVVVSAWQEEVKHDQTWTWDEYVDAVRDPDRRSAKPARGFWLRQDLSAILDIWADAVPPERIHVVTVPPSGGDPEELVKRFASVVGFDAGLLTNAPRWDNQTLGVAGTEVIRRLNGLLDHRLNERQYNRVINATLVRALSRSRTSPQPKLPDSELEWVSAWAQDTVARVASGGYQVVGDLEELLPSSTGTSARPDAVSTDELLEAAMTALADLSENYATSWWSKRKPDVAVEGISRRARLASRGRGAVFRVGRRLAHLADRHPAMARPMGVYLRMRQAPRRSRLRR